MKVFQQQQILARMAVSQMRKQQLYNPKTLDQDQANHP